MPPRKVSLPKRFKDSWDSSATSLFGQWCARLEWQWGKGMIEADEGYFTVEASAVERSKQKAGRGSKTKSNVMVMAESTVLEDVETGKIDRQCRYFKAKVLEDHKIEGTDGTLKDAIDGETSIVFSDKSTSYLNIED